MDVLGNVIKNEQKSIDLYQSIADKTSLKSLKGFFTELAVVRKKHLEEIRGGNGNTPAGKYGAPAIHGVRHFLRQIVDDDGVAGLPRHEFHVFREAMNCGGNTLKQYECFLNMGINEDQKAFLENVMEREKIHYAVVKDLCVLISEQQSAH